MNAKAHKIPASTEREYNITKDDLPLSCPTQEMILWNAHPRVYLPIEKTGRETCPYCGSTFILEDVSDNDAT
jgi:uncharacterized Zn-finger protein